MKIFGKCGKCKTTFSFRSYAQTRVEFAMNEGETKQHRCYHCNHQNEIHVNELTAKESKIAQLIAALVLIIGTPLFFIILGGLKFTLYKYSYLIGGLFLVPVTIYAIIQKQERNRVNSFNRLKL